MAEQNKKLFTYEALTELVSQIKNADSTLKTELEGKITSANSDVTALKALHALKEDGSYETVAAEAAAAANTAVTNLVDGAPEALDTLKEIADWIASDETKSANILASVQANTAALETLNGADTVAGSVAAQVKAAIEALDAEVEDVSGEFVGVKITQVDGKLNSVVVTDKREFVTTDEVAALFA